MSKKDEDKILNGSYDGITEYDNDLPQWWVWLFYITIIFSGFYIGWYHYYPGKNNEIKLAEGMKQIESMKIASNAATTSVGSMRLDEAGLFKLVSDSKALEVGKNVYVAKCAMCHANAGEGLIGPNLTDDYWIHGAKLEQIRTVIENGVLEKGMLAWKGQISATEIDSVVAYIRSLHGTNPANAKAPQGELVKID
jgi:cytochrome c oxidase cbb3-type subunit 3